MGEEGAVSHGPPILSERVGQVKPGHRSHKPLTQTLTHPGAGGSIDGGRIGAGWFLGREGLRGRRLDDGGLSGVLDADVPARALRFGWTPGGTKGG